MKSFRFPRIFSIILPLFLLILTAPGGELYAKTATTPPTNHLADTPELSGVYFGVRHGESVPSAQHRVCGSMEAGIDPANGLTEKGKEEVIQNTTVWIKENKKLISKYLEKNNLVIISSPFSRARETAEIVADVIQEKLKKKLPKSMRAPGSLRKSIIIDNSLRERYFGKYEGQENSGEIYKKVWAEDAKNPAQTKGKVESANAVQDRATALIANLEKESQASGGRMFLLVAHGDTLKITQTGFQKQSASAHQDPNLVPPFKTAEIRQFQLSPGTGSSTAGR